MLTTHARYASVCVIAVLLCAGAASISSEALYGDDMADPTYDTANSSGAPSVQGYGDGVIYDSAGAASVTYDPASVRLSVTLPFSGGDLCC